MLGSLWNYLRKRSRDSILLGANDAVEIINQSHDEDENADPGKLLAGRIGVVLLPNGTEDTKALTHQKGGKKR